MTTTRIGVGWALRIRAHGLICGQETSYRVVLPTMPEPTTVSVRLGTTAEPMLKMQVPKYTLSGETFVPFESPLPEGVRGSWLTLITSTPRNIDGGLMSRFQSAKYDPAIRSEIDLAVGAATFGAAQQLADLYAGAFLLQHPNSYPELWHEARVYWLSDVDNVIGTDSNTFRVLPGPTSSSKAQLEELARVAGSVVLATSKTRKIVEVVSRLLLVAHSMSEGSNERFLTCFQAIEALCTLVPQGPTNERRDAFKALENLVEAAGAQPEPVLSLLNSLKSAAHNVSLGERFARLAAHYENAAQAADDAKTFDRLNRARNDLIHGRATSIPAHAGDLVLQDAVRDAPLRYLSRVVEQVVRDHPTQRQG